MGITLNISETAEWFDTSHATIRDLIKAYRLDTVRMRHNGKAKGLTLPSLCVIARALNRPEPTARAIEARFAAVA